MPNRSLSQDELTKLFQPLFKSVQQRLEQLSSGDRQLLFALRRKLFKELIYLERDKPAARKTLKAKKRKLQKDRCAVCQKKLPARGTVLDRFSAIEGYTLENTRLICPQCDIKIQTARGYT
ncbi:MAG: hypothetical protein HJJLKODD_01233 [Phycisphaerae bacterium]|nr:hypothetical protein [Phycisphaerae bacterium]